MTQSIFITASNPFGFPVGSTQSVSDAVALQAIGGDLSPQGAWGKLASVIPANPQTPVQRAAGASDLDWGRKRKPTPTGVLLVPGDSIGAGYGLTTPSASRFGAVVAAAKGWAETNVAISGSVIGRWVNDAIGSRVINAGDSSLLIAGFNDARFGGATANNLSQYVSNLIGTICYLALPDSAKVYSQSNNATLNPALTFSGTWPTSSTWQALQAQSRCGAYSATASSYVEGVVTGDTVHVMLGGYIAFAASCSVSIDGVSLGAGAFSVQPLLDVPDGLGGTVWQPYCIRIPGLANGKHTVRVTIVASANLLVAYMAGYDSTSSALCPVYVAGNPRMTAAGYAVAPANANDTIMRQYQNETRRVCETLAAEGLLVRYLDFDAKWLPSAGVVQADSVHPYEMIHKLWGQAASYEMNRPSLT